MYYLFLPRASALTYISIKDRAVSRERMLLPFSEQSSFQCSNWTSFYDLVYIHFPEFQKTKPDLLGNQQDYRLTEWFRLFKTTKVSDEWDPPYRNSFKRCDQIFIISIWSHSQRLNTANHSMQPLSCHNIWALITTINHTQ